MASVRLTLPSRCGTRIHPCGYEIGVTFCLRPCPVLFGAVTRLPAKTATGPSEGDQHAGSLRMVQG